MDRLTPEQKKRLKKARDMIKESVGILRNIDIETHPFRREEFTRDNPFVCEILEYGIQII